MFNINVIFKNSTLVNSMLVKTLQNQMLIAYTEFFSNKTSIYIGQRSLSARIEQHEYSVKCAQELSVFFSFACKRP